MKDRHTWTLNVTGKRATARPSLDSVYRRAIEWAARSLRAPKMRLLDANGELFTSAQPYQDWSHMLRTDALFPAHDPATLKQRREWLESHEAELAERRAHGATFLDLAATRLGRPDLAEAASHFRAIHTLVEQIWSRSGGRGSPDSHLVYAGTDIRNRIADLVLAIGERDAAAAALL